MKIIVLQFYNDSIEQGKCSWYDFSMFSGIVPASGDLAYGKKGYALCAISIPCVRAFVKKLK